MKRLIIIIIAGALIVFYPIMLSAYLHDDAVSTKSEIHSNRIIIKLRVDPTSDGKIPNGNAAAQAVESVERFSKSLGIAKMDPLFSEHSLSHENNILSNIYIIQCPQGIEPQEGANQYADLPEVEYAQPDYCLELYERPNDPMYMIQWPLINLGQSYPFILRREGPNNDSLIMVRGIADADIDADEVLSNPPENTSAVVVAVIDTGVDRFHPDLSGRVWHNPGEIPENGIDDDHNGYIDDYWGWDYTGDNSVFPPIPDNDPADEYGHGTHCAGIIASLTSNDEGISGIVSECKIMVLKFYSVMLSSYAARAIIYAADNGADVISISFGYPWQVNILEDAINYARAKGVVICAASGNDEGEYQNYPGCYDGVISVGASTSSDEVAFFSTYGSYLDVVAPGYSILSLRGAGTDMYAPNEPNVHIINDDYYIASGTSMASPHASAVAAYMRAISPGLTPDKVQKIMQETADDIVDPFGYGQNYPGWDKFSGYGRVNLYSAIQAIPVAKAIIQSPQPNQLISGIFEITGTASSDSLPVYSLSYGSGDLPTSWITLNTSSQSVTDDILGAFNTGGLNGTYTMKLTAGNDNEKMVTVNIVNTATAQITSPSQNDSLSVLIPIAGSAICPGFDHYTLEYGSGPVPQEWIPIGTYTIPAWNDEFLAWDVSNIPPGTYSIRLLLYSSSGPVSGDTVRIYVKSAYWGENSWKIHVDAMLSAQVNYGDLDNDGNNEIIVGTTSGILFFNCDGTLKTDNIPEVPNYNFRMTPAVGDLDGDGIDDLVAVGVDWNIGKLLGFPSSGQPFEAYLLRTPFLDFLNTDLEYIYPQVFLKDFDGDGKDEIFYFDEPDCWIYDSDGSFIMRFPTLPATSPRHFLSADIDGDGHDEFYTSNNYVCQFDLYGTYIKCVPMSMGLGIEYESRSISAVDIDGDGKLELIVLGRFLDKGGNYWLYAFDENLTLKPGWPRNTGINGFLVPTAPIIGDMDSDGDLEYFISFFELVQGMIYAWNMDGTPYKGSNPIFASTTEPSRIYYSLLADINGDNYPEIVSCVRDDVFDQYNIERMIAWDKDGNVLDGWPIITRPASIPWQNNCVHTATIGDINSDGFTALLATTPLNDLIFINFENASYNPQSCPVPFWHYNRKMNNTECIEEDFACGDMNGDNISNVNDAVYLINYIFVPGSPEPVQLLSGDTNCDSRVNLVDIVWIVNYIFRGGYAPCDQDGDGIPDC